MCAAREVRQESRGFSPNELVLAHTVRDLLVTVAGRETQPCKNLLNYVNVFDTGFT